MSPRRESTDESTEFQAAVALAAGLALAMAVAAWKPSMAVAAPLALGASSSIDRLKEISSISTGSLSQAITKALLLPVITAFALFSDVIEAILSVPIEVLGGFETALVDLVGALFGAPASFIETSWLVGEAGLSPFGIIAPLVGLGIFLIAGWMISNYLQEEETGDLIPWSFTDIPGLGVDEEGGD